MPGHPRPRDPQSALRGRGALPGRDRVRDGHRPGAVSRVQRARGPHRRLSASGSAGRAGPHRRDRGQRVDPRGARLRRGPSARGAVAGQGPAPRTRGATDRRSRSTRAAGRLPGSGRDLRGGNAPLLPPARLCRRTAVPASVVDLIPTGDCWLSLSRGSQAGCVSEVGLGGHLRRIRSRRRRGGSRWLFAFAPALCALPWLCNW